MPIRKCTDETTRKITRRVGDGKSGLFALLCLILVAGVAWAQSPPDVRPYTGPEKDVPIVLITLGNKTIQGVVADTESSRVRGLLGWETISEDAGMLLDFEREGKYAIHMQGMKFPIDALWIDGNRVIKLIYPEIRPNSGMIYPSMVPSRYCLEIKAGFSKKFGIKIGQHVEFSLAQPQPPKNKGQ